MAKIKMPKNKVVDLDELGDVDGLPPSPSQVVSLFLPPLCAEEILAKCKKITIDELGEALIHFGNAMASGAPPSLRMDFDVVSDGQEITGKIIVQGKQTQSFSGPDLPSVVSTSMRAVAEQNAYQAEDDATRVTVLTQWSRGLFLISAGIDASCNSILAASAMRYKESEPKKEREPVFKGPGTHRTE